MDSTRNVLFAFFTMVFVCMTAYLTLLALSIVSAFVLPQSWQWIPTVVMLVFVCTFVVFTCIIYALVCLFLARELNGRAKLPALHAHMPASRYISIQPHMAKWWTQVRK